MLQDKVWGFIDLSGRMAIAPRFREPGTFSCGRLIVNESGGWLMLDGTGELLAGNKGNCRHSFSEGLLIAPWEDRAHAVLDTTGRPAMILPAYARGKGFELIGDFSEGCSTLLLGKNGRVIMDRAGRFVCHVSQKDFGPATRVREGKCVVWDKDAFGYIDLIGQLVIPPRFKLAWPFYQGLAQIATSTGVGFIDHAGQEVIPSRYAFAAHFEQNLVCVRDAKTTYLINRSGQVVWPK